MAEASCETDPEIGIGRDPGSAPTAPAADQASNPSGSVAGRALPVAGSLTLVAMGGCTGTLVPTTTLAINVVGALALGLLLGSLGERRPRLRLILGTGVLGGLTTHSTFILESHRLLASDGSTGRPALGAAYLLGSMVAGLAAAAVGLWLAGRLRRREAS